MLNIDQEKALESILTWYYNNNGEMNYVLDGDAGTGKSYLLNSILEKLSDVEILLLASTNEALYQFRDKVSNPGNYIFKTVHSSLGIVPTDDGKLDNFKQRTLPAFWNNYQLAIVDECFHPTVELLTDRGFIPINEIVNNPLNSTLVASMDMETKLVSFDKPIRYVCKDYEGDMLELKTDKILSFHTTAKHDHVTIDTITGELVKAPLAKQLGRNKFYLTATSGLVSDKNELTPIERLAIAFQADGSYNNYGKAVSYSDKGSFSSSETSICFSFSKQRKQDRLLLILKDLDLIPSITTENQPSGANVKLRTQYRIARIPCKAVSKRLIDVFCLADMTKDYALSFLQEVVEWDGYRDPNGTSLYYSSTVKSNVDFVQAVAVLAGYKTNQTVQHDDRKDSFNDVYRLFMSDNIVSGAIFKVKNKIVTRTYSGKVYCVTMPKGTVITRYNGQVSVSGNCSMIPESILTMLINIGIKILWVGDSKQHAPVEKNITSRSKCTSPVFEQGWGSVTLTLQMRNKGELTTFCSLTASNVTTGQRYIPNTFDISKRDLLTHIDNNIEEIHSGGIKTLAYSNKTVTMFNNLVRGKIFKSAAIDNLFLPIDKIILTSPLSIIPDFEKIGDKELAKLSYSDLETYYSNTKFEVICSSEVTVRLNNKLHIGCYKIKVVLNNIETYIHVPIDPLDRVRIGDYYLHLAFNTNGSKERIKVFKLRRLILFSFAEVLHYYAATTHRVQGASLDKVIVLYSDILKINNVTLQNKSIYVACSRAKKELKIYRGLL